MFKQLSIKSEAGSLKILFNCKKGAFDFVAFVTDVCGLLNNVFFPEIIYVFSLLLLYFHLDVFVAVSKSFPLFALLGVDNEKVCECWWQIAVNRPQHIVISLEW